VRQDRRDVATENILVEDILTFVVLSPTVPHRLETITNAVADLDRQGLSRVVSATSRPAPVQFFTDINPGDLRVDGVAILLWKASPCRALLPRLY
jgi:hypothetical protein